MRALRDVLVVGGGPAGLAAAIACAARGLDVLVLERRGGPVDKACGEGLLPRAVAALEALGARWRLGPEDAAQFRAIRWVGEDGTFAEGRLPPPGGLGVRRTALRAALLARAREAGAEVRDGVEVSNHRRQGERVLAETADGPVQARMLVAADGLASQVRRREGLEAPSLAPRRFGLRRHFATAAGSDAVEVHFGDRAEAYLTPVGKGRVGLAFLFEEEVSPSWNALLERFPLLAKRFAGMAFDSHLAGAGPLARASLARVGDRLVLAGDAAGYVDAITGEGLSLALEGALHLGRILPQALERGGGADALRPYQRAVAGAWRRYALVTRLVLSMARRPRLRRAVVRRLARQPRLFDALVARALGTAPRSV